jgi:hypothetical protein
MTGEFLGSSEFLGFLGFLGGTFAEELRGTPEEPRGTPIA